VLNSWLRTFPGSLAGSADLAKSNKTNLLFEGRGRSFPDEYAGRNIHFGVREHGMGAAVNGMTLSGLRGFAATFLTFQRLHARQHASWPP